MNVQVVSSFPTISFMKSVNYGEKFVIGLVHSSGGHISGGLPNHYVQIRGVENSNYVHYWNWGENFDRKSHISGNIHGIHMIYLINR